MYGKKLKKTMTWWKNVRLVFICRSKNNKSLSYQSGNVGSNITHDHRRSLGEYIEVQAIVIDFDKKKAIVIDSNKKKGRII